MIRYTKFYTHAFPAVGTEAGVQVDRIQSIDATATLNRDKNKEVGRDGTIDWAKKTPTISYRLAQKESQNIEFLEKLAGVPAGTTITQNSFNTAATDLVAYIVDDSAVTLGSIWYPKLRVGGFSLTAADPDAHLERSFDLVGESTKEFQGTNKYLICLTETADSGEVVATDWTKTLTDPTPVVDPVGGAYMFRVTRIRSGVTTDLTAGSGANQYEYSNSTHILTVHTAAVGDVYKIIYTAGSYIGATALFTNNDSDVGSTLAYNVSAYLGTTLLTRIQGVTIDVKFDREDWKEIGNKEVVQRGVKNKTVTITLPRLLEAYTLEELLLGQTTGYAHIDVENFLDNLTFRFKIYETTSKATFAWGIKVSNLSPIDVKTGVSIDNYTNRDLTLESEEFTISSVEATIDA